ncbi:hypothetical protein D3C87_91650 [compost metagenome]
MSSVATCAILSLANTRKIHWYLIHYLYVMKNTLLILVAAIGLTACYKTKSFDSISKGMTKDKVTELVGEPEEKMPMFVAEWWMYRKENKVVVMHSDTVLRVVKDLKSVQDSMKSLGDELQKLLPSSPPNQKTSNRQTSGNQSSQKRQ